MAYGSTSYILTDDASVSDSRSESDSFQHESNDSEITFSERLKICCKPKYQPRKLKNKGAVLVLVWNFLVMAVYYYLYYKSVTPETICPTCFQFILLPTGIIVLFAGWLADVYVERYKVLRWSIIIMWISSLLLTTTFVIEKIVTLTNYYQLVFLFSLGIGYGMFQANIIQFGIDQLTDASSNEIVSFINWYAWSFVSSAVAINFTSKCTSPQYSFIAPLMLCVALSVVASSLFLCNKVLIKEPVTQNPFKLIYRVLKYALKHKYARQRSAFTYCEDELPSRLDFGKSKYGGPFTTEQVEDVKTFFGALGLVLIGSSIFSMTDENYFQSLISDETTVDKINIYPLSKCSYKFIFTDIHYITGALLIPLNEIIVHPVFQRCTPSSVSTGKVVIGFILQVIRYILMVLFITLSRQHYIKFDQFYNYNTTLACTFYNALDEPGVNIFITIYDFRLYAIPYVIFSVSYIMILVGVIEFLCAQIPYSMKGVIVGLFYGSLVIFYAINKGITKIFIATSSVWSGDTSIISCGFWYLLIKIIYVLIVVFIIFLLIIIYKKRKREDVLPNEHFFAERYYSKKLEEQIN